MDLIAVIGVAIVATVLAIILKQYKPEYRLFVSLGAGIIILVFIVDSAAPVVEQVSSLLAVTGMSTEYLEILLKSLGICFLSQLACDACRDAGESAIASKVETAGKMAVLVLSLPLVTQLLSVAGSLFSL